jgi:pimeloyl-ACP methyl ester carboxylesterase
MAFDTDDTDDFGDYDEFGMLGDNAAEAGLSLTGPPRVARTAFTIADGRSVSAIAWGDAEPELVLLHGGGQNAHTWDTVAPPAAGDRPARPRPLRPPRRP